MGIKERRTKMLLALFFLNDVSESYILFDGVVQRIFDLSLNQKTKGTISALIKEGVIEKEGEGSTLSYRLTESGFNELFLTIPLFRFMKSEWDGKWRILSYEIPESKRELRDRLRREVAGWGLGPWHRSFWVTPHPIISNLHSLVSNQEEEEYIQAFEAEHVFGDRQILIDKVWNVKHLEQEYRNLFKRWHEILSSDSDREEKMKRVLAEYVPVLRTDPGLPNALVGSQWIGFEAFSIFKEIREILLSA